MFLLTPATVESAAQLGRADVVPAPCMAGSDLVSYLDAAGDVAATLELAVTS
jgi:hypothetical protein